MSRVNTTNVEAIIKPNFFWKNSPITFITFKPVDGTSKLEIYKKDDSEGWVLEDTVNVYTDSIGKNPVIEPRTEMFYQYNLTLKVVPTNCSYSVD